MPTSFLDNIPTIVRIVQRLEPGRVLDVGIGHGKYGLLTREYLSGDTGRSDIVVDGLEGFSGYVGEIQRAIYDQVLIADIRELDFGALDYDLYLLIDVLEHVPKEEGHRILAAMAGTVLVSTPKEDYRAHYAHNPLEDHQSHWVIGDFARYPMHDFSNDNATIVVLDTRRPGAGG
jgi:2-polyprenyl-3-methyl-5-hydroxy-6-metoxy-1,4-benzoquinol methylase